MAPNGAFLQYSIILIINSATNSNKHQRAEGKIIEGKIIDQEYNTIIVSIFAL
jgi:hypothetical protein